MYVDYFQLQREPFRAAPKGSDVFVGPQTAKIMKSLRNALAHPDAVVAVTGPAGVGKTTLVNRALDAMSDSMSVVRLPRAKLAHDEVLDFLLQQLQATKIPASSIRKMLLCRSLLATHANNDKPVCIVVEDAMRIGTDALIELEALTAADGHETPGARTVLIGDNELAQSLQGNPELARLNLRLRLRFPVQTFDRQELLAYLKHNFRLAGADFEIIFTEGCDTALAALSAGNPRLANKLVEASLLAAAEQQIDEIDPAFVADVARDEFDLHYNVPAVNGTSRPQARDQAHHNKSAGDANGFGTPLPVSAAEATAIAADRVPAEDAASSAVNASDDESSNTITAEKLVLPDEHASLVAVAGRAAAVDDEIEDSPQPHAPTASSADQASTAINPELTGRVAQPAAQAEPLINASLPDLDDIAAEFDQIAAAPVARPDIDESLDSEPELSQQAPPETSSDTSTELPMLFSSAKIQAPQAELPCQPSSSQPASEAPVADLPEFDGAPVNDEDSESPDEQPARSAETPDWERDPTLAELRPDIEALEAAMAEFSVEEEPQKKRDEEPDPEIELKDPTFVGVPEITLDVAIQEKIAEATAALEKHDATIAEEEIDDAPATSQPVAQASPDTSAPATMNTSARNETTIEKDSPAVPTPEIEAVTEPDPIDEVALGISKARSLEDVDDKMAETLFGQEFSDIAAQICANPPVADHTGSAEKAEELTLVADEPVPAAEPEVVGSGVSQPSAMEQEFREVYGDDALEVSLQSEQPRGGLDLSASQRLATVRALNANKGLASSQARVAVNAATANNMAPPAPPPKPIEDQINTSMSQTLQALNSRRVPANDDDDERTNNRTGFFSRFKR